MNIEDTASALQALADRAGDAIERGLDRLKRLRNHPARYVGRHRAPGTLQRLTASWRAAMQPLLEAHREAQARRDAERAKLDGLVQWWEQRRGDYAPAYARAGAA